MVGPVPFASRPPRPLSRSRNHPTLLTAVPEGQLPAQNRRPLSQLNRRMGVLVRCWFCSILQSCAVWTVGYKKSLGKSNRSTTVVSPFSGTVGAVHPPPQPKRSSVVVVSNCPGFALCSPTRKPKIGSHYSILHFVSSCPQDCRFGLVIERTGT